MKKLPEFIYSKKELFNSLAGFNVEKVRPVLNEIISKNRSIPLNDAKKERTLKYAEVVKVFEYFGEDERIKAKNEKQSA